MPRKKFSELRNQPIVAVKPNGKGGFDALPTSFVPKAYSGPATKPTSQAKTSPLMPHDQRRKLIETPFMSRRIPPKSWGGVNVGNAGQVPESGHRTWQLSAADESYLRYGRSDDDTQGD